jgi:hypothetical protein
MWRVPRSAERAREKLKRPKVLITIALFTNQTNTAVCAEMVRALIGKQGLKIILNDFTKLGENIVFLIL